MAAKSGLQMMNIEQRAPRRREPELADVMPHRRGQSSRPKVSYGLTRQNRRSWYIRRRNQLLRRLGLVSAGLVFTIVLVWKIAGAFGGGNVEADNGQWENQDLLTKNSVKEQQMSLVKEPEESTQPVIVLDAGHGGEDPGTSGGNIREKEINFKIVKKLQAILEEKGYQVVLTRTDDTLIQLSRRVEIAKEAKADVFVSIHQNALEKDTQTSGIQTYCCQGANEDSVKLADSIHSQLLDATGAIDRGSIHDSDFHVVINNPVPACLVETGFLTSTEERDKLASDSYQETLAQAIADGIVKYLESL